MRRSDQRRIVVLGYIIRMPLGGLVWHYLQFAMGLARLGHDVYYFEDSCFFEQDARSWYYDPVSLSVGAHPTSGGLRLAKEIFDKTGFGDRWAFFDARQARWHGPVEDQAREICATADLVLNVSAANPLRGVLAQVPVRVFIDTDPVFSQVRILTDPTRRALALQHNRFFTLGENIASGKSNAPQDGLPWKATRQPILLDAWPITPGPKNGRFTTLMAWDSFAVEEYNGVSYGMKSKSFRTFLDLPKKTNTPFELALFDPTAVPEEFHLLGWSIRDGKALTADPWAYQSYIHGSKGEFSVAKHGYVISRSGWFSDRSATYLASGRPILVQETGFSDWLETGCGVISFRNSRTGGRRGRGN